MTAVAIHLSISLLLACHRNASYIRRSAGTVSIALRTPERSATSRRGITLYEHRACITHRVTPRVGRRALAGSLNCLGHNLRHGGGNVLDRIYAKIGDDLACKLPAKDFNGFGLVLLIKTSIAAREELRSEQCIYLLEQLGLVWCEATGLKIVRILFVPERDTLCDCQLVVCCFSVRERKFAERIGSCA